MANGSAEVSGKVFLPGKLALVTGAASGIGLAVAKNLAGRGMKVVLSDFNAKALPEAEAQVKAAGAKETLAITMDITKPEDWTRCRETLMSRFGEAPAFFHNNAGAGTTAFGLIWDIPDDDWQKTLNVNLHGCLNGIRAILPAMVAQKSPGIVVSTASGAGMINMANGGGASYGTAKAGVILAMECCFADLRKVKAPIAAHVLMPMLTNTNIGVNSILVDGYKDRRSNAFTEKVGQSPEELAEHLIASCVSATPEKPNFYVYGSDSSTNFPMFKEMIQWRFTDMTENRGAMSHVHELRDDYLKHLREIRSKTMPKRAAKL